MKTNGTANLNHNKPNSQDKCKDGQTEEKALGPSS